LHYRLQRHLLAAFVSSALIIVTAASGSAITRDQAIAIVTTTIIDTSAVRESIHAYALQSTVAPGAVIGQNTIDDLAVAPATCWFFWLDMSPVALFAHDTKIVLVRESDGAIVLVIDAEWWPTVNGVSYYINQLDRDTTPDLFWLAGAPYPLLGAERARAPEPPATDAPPRDAWLDRFIRDLDDEAGAAAGTWGIIICPYDTAANPNMAADVRCAISSFATLGATGKDAIAAAPVIVHKTKQQTCDAIDALPNDCTKLHVYWIGHGKPDSLFFEDGSAMTAMELACKLKDQNATEYCVTIEACFSGSILDDLAAKGVNGFHIMTTSATTSALFFGDSHWTGSFVGAWFSHYLWECIAGGKRGADAFAWADSQVAALKDSVKAGADSTKWKPYVDQPKPTGGYVHVFGGGGAGTAGGGEAFCFKIAQGCSTGCINIPGGAGSDTCGNFTLSCETTTGSGTSWVKSGTHNWTKGRTIYFRTYGVPGATGNYKITMHSNKGGVRSLISWLGDTATPVTPPTVSEFNAHSVGWIDFSGGEFNRFLGEGTNGIWGYGWNDGIVFDQIPAMTGPNWFNQLQVQLPIQIDPSRPQLYVNGDPLQGFVENTVLVFVAASLQNPLGGPGQAAQLQAQAFQPSVGLFDSFTGQFQSPPGGASKGIVPPGLQLVWDMGTIRPEPLMLTINVFGPDAVEWDALLLAPIGAVGTEVPGPPVPPLVTRLYQNAPNPLRDRTTIAFDLNEPAWTRVSVYDTSGRLVRTLVSESRARGRNFAFWDGRTDDGVRAASGIYVYRLETPSAAESRSLVLVR